MNNELFFFFSQLNETSVCKYYWREPRLAFPLRQVTESDKTKKKKKMVKSPNWVLSHFLLGWFHRSRAASTQVTTTLWLQGSADNAQPFAAFLIFQSVARVGKKKRRCLAPTMHAVLQHNVMHDSEEEGKKTKQNESKSQISSVSLRVCFNFVLHVEGRQAQFLFLHLLLFKHSLKRESSLTQVAPRLPLKRAACDDGQPTGFLFFGKRGGQTDRQTCAEAIVPSFLPYSAKLTN